MVCAGAGLANAQTAGASKKSTYSIGVDADFSGPFAYYGTVNKDAWNAVFDAVNKKGGIDGHKIKLIYLDNSSTPTTIVSDAKELVGDKVLLVRSDPTSDACANIYTVTAKSHIPLSCEAIGLTTVTPPRPGLYTSQLPEPLFMTGVYKNIVKLTIFVYDMLEFQNVNDVLKKFFPQKPPAVTVCGAQLSFGFKIEIECIAIVA